MPHTAARTKNAIWDYRLDAASLAPGQSQRAGLDLAGSQRFIVRRDSREQNRHAS